MRWTFVGSFANYNQMAVSNDLVKNRGTRNTSTSSTTFKCFSCFAPIIDDDDDLLPSPSSTASDTSSVRRRKSALRSLSGSIKSFFSKTPLLKKLQGKRRRSSKSMRLTGSGDYKSSVPGDEIFSEPGECFGEGSEQSSSLFTSTTSSTISSSGSERTADQDFGQTMGARNKFRQMVKRMGNVLNSYGRMYIFLIICLAVLVFCGKAFAIATCTSAWLFFSHAKAAAVAVAARSGNWGRWDG